MFSPEPTRAQSLRPKRTRQTAGGEDIKLPQAKRKRSALRRDTFEPLTEASLNEVAGRDVVEDKSNGHVTPATAATRDLTLRGAKHADKRAERGTSSTGVALTLSSNDFYAVAQLPALPEQVRLHPSVPYSCVIAPEYGYALALTHTDAVIWPYQSNLSTPPSRDVIAFKLPFPPSSVDDPLPLATFTAKSARGEPGLVAVSAKWAKVVYWETISNASSFVPGQTSSVQGSIPGVVSGEIVEDIVNAEPSGFILSLRHGRVAHLTIRDQMGRPGIGVQFLRKYTTGSAGLLGSIRHVFGGDRRRGVPIVKAGGSRKGQRDVVIATEDAELEFWNTNLSVGNSLESSFSFKKEVEDALTGLVPDPTRFKILDVELSAGPSTAVTRKDSPGAPMMVLASVAVDDEIKYYLIDMIIDEKAKTKVVHPITCYAASAAAPATDDHPTWRPRLCVAKHRPVAFILWETAVVVFSLVKRPESPSSQLLLERPPPPVPFQDGIRFQASTIYRVLGSVLETTDTSSVVLAVLGFGLVRVTSLLRDPTDADGDEAEDRVSAKSKIEQAVFFGTMKQNPLDLQTVSQTFSDDEIEQAALDISAEILSSTSRHLPKTAPSIDMQMRLRAKALDDLVHHLMKHYPAAISRHARFELLWNAEKLAAAQALWKVQEEIQRHYPCEGREMSYLDFTLRALHESRQKYPDPEKGEKDRVRHWLVHSIDHIDHLMSELVSCIPELEPMDVTDPCIVADYLKEAVDLWSASYTAAFKFREDYAPTYGLGDEVFTEGVLKAGFPIDLPHPWTSRPEPFRFGQRLIYDICNFLSEWWRVSLGEQKKKMPTDLDGKPYEAPTMASLKSLAARLPTEVELFSRIVMEEYTQAVCHLTALRKEADVLKDEVRDIKKEKRNRLAQALEAMAPYNRMGAIELAEKLQDCGKLVDLHCDYYTQLLRDAAENPSLHDVNHEKMREMQARAETYFDRFGKPFVFASFSQMVKDDGSGRLLTKGQEDDDKKKFLSWFFRQARKFGQEVGKVSWIHDVVGANDYVRAETTLQTLAVQEMDNVWNKKTELALAKLAGLAAAEDRATRPATTNPYDHKLDIVEIQERIYKHVMASVGAAVDDKAANDLAVENFASRVVTKSPALKRLLKAALKALMHHTPLAVEELMDLLTLMDPVEWMGMPEDDPEITGQEFGIALRVVDISGFPAPKQDDCRALIWRRAMIRDDWLVLNETSGKDDVQVEGEMQLTSLFRALQHVFLAEQVDGTTVHIATPQEVLNQDVFPTSLQDRFSENEKEGLRKDLDKEQARLKTYVEKGRLEDHYGGLLASAQRTVREAFGGQGEELAQHAVADDSD